MLRTMKREPKISHMCMSGITGSERYRKKWKMTQKQESHEANVLSENWLEVIGNFHP